MPGIGRVSEQELGALGFDDCGALLGPQRSLLAALMSPIALDFLCHAALGLAATRHDPKVDTDKEPGRKGIGVERTFRARSTWGELQATVGSTHVQHKPTNFKIKKA